MKTGGLALASQMWGQIPPDRTYGRYGAGDNDPITATYRYLNPRPLARLRPEAISRLDLFVGHFPYAARSLMGTDVLTFTVLRDPVERVISALKHAKRYHLEHHGLSLEEIYEDEWYFARFLDNHEVKMLAMTAEEMLAHSPMDGWDREGWSLEDQALLHRWREDATSLSETESLRFHNLAAPIATSGEQGVSRLLGAPNTAGVVVDDARLRRAIENLESVDIVGLFDDYDSLLIELSIRLGLQLRSGIRRNVGGDENVSHALRARIASHLGPSLELYETARTRAK